MWLSSEPSSRWTVSSHKNWGKNPSNKSILQVLNQNMAAYEKGFWKSIIVPQINGGESVPVWWESLSNKMNIFLQCDFDHPLIQNFYQKVDEGYNTAIEDPKFKEWYETKKLPIRGELFLRLSAYTSIFNKMFTRKENSARERHEYYKKQEVALLSEILEKGIFMCAELASLAHYYLKTHGVDNFYVWWELLPKLYEESEELRGEAHSFIYLRDNNIQLIYDPAFPIKTSNAGFLFPKIQEILNDSDFLKLFRMKKQQFVEAKDLLCTDSKFYYGFWNWSCIYPENILLWSESKQQNKD